MHTMTANIVLNFHPRAQQWSIILELPTLNLVFEGHHSKMKKKDEKNVVF